MAITQITVILQKDGATFASDTEANANRFSGYPDLFNQAINANKAMVDDGTITEPVSRSWNATDFTLTLIKLVANIDNYNSVWDPIEAEVRVAETANGWTQVLSTSTPV
jgi:hypothetical protein